MKLIPTGVGYLTSQLFSNVYLNRLDQYVKRKLTFKHYGRYVDDCYIVSTDKVRLILVYPNITSAFGSVSSNSSMYLYVK